MAHIRNIGKQPMGFFDETGNSHVVQRGAEADIPMTEPYYAKLEAILSKCDPKPYELTGGAGGKPPKEVKKSEPVKSDSDKQQDKVKG
jgi:hypothetical protein